MITDNLNEISNALAAMQGTAMLAMTGFGALGVLSCIWLGFLIGHPTLGLDRLMKLEGST